MEIEQTCALHAVPRQRLWKKPERRPSDWTIQDELLLKPRGWMQALESSRPYRRGAVTSPDHRRSFTQLKEQWERETANVSSVTRIILNEAYQRIIGMGPTALPMIFSTLKEEGGLWFPALKSITGADPVPEHERGDTEAMRQSWLDWATRHGYL